jgi:hypothetical protein
MVFFLSFLSVLAYMDTPCLQIKLHTSESNFDFEKHRYVYGKSSTLLWRAIGGGLLLTVMPATLLALREFAKDDDLAQEMPRTLNLGLMGTAIGHLLVLGG